jgi:hypothetical protein
MNSLMRICGFATTAFVLSVAAPSAKAEDNTSASTCQDVGTNTPEPLGDREGHSISVEAYSCRLDSGPLAGGVLTGTVIWEWEKTNATMLSNGGVIRKPGSTATFVTDGKLALTLADGKVTGGVVTGHGTYSVAAGGAASLAGKSFSYTSTLTGPGEFTIVVKLD